MGELILLGVIAIVAVAWFGVGLIRNQLKKPDLLAADYVVFRTQPAVLPMLERDMSEAGWRLENTANQGGGSLYRFEKAGAGSASLASLLEADGVMQRTANRSVAADIIIAVDDFGPRKSAHA